MIGFPVQKDVSLAELTRLTIAIEKCGFKIAEPHGAAVIQKFGAVLERLTAVERDLVITLVEDFLYCPFFDYIPLLTQALRGLPASLTKGKSSLILLPLAETGKNGKPKSSSALLYPAEHLVLPYLAPFSTFSVKGFEKMELLATEASTRKNTLLIFVDDFIGSGGTAVTAIKRYRKNFAASTDSAAIVAIVAQRQGLMRIAGEGIPVSVAIQRSKGISESARLPNRASALAMMDDLEKRLGVAKDYLRGYEACEALVTMVRTPNNTFPVFWHPTTAAGIKWPAPFRRF